MGELVSTLQVGREGMPSAQELGQDRKGVDASDIKCPSEGPLMAVQEFDRVQAMPVSPPPPLPEKLPPPPAADLQQALIGWAAAWSDKDYPQYIGYYSSGFQPEAGHSLTKWMNERRTRLGKPGDIRVDISDLKIEQPEKEKAITEFRQTYSSRDYRDIVTKRMDWAREDGQWKITREQVLAPLPSISDPLPKKSRPGKRVKYCPCPPTAK
jgi:hypothetical protein